MFSRVVVRLAAFNVIVLLFLLAMVLVAVFFSVKIAIERDARNDLNSAADVVSDVALRELGKASVEVEHSEGEEEEEEEDHSESVRSVFSTESESSSDSLTRAFPFFVIRSSGEIVSGVPLSESGLPNLNSARDAMRSGEDWRTIDTEQGPVQVLSRAVVEDGVAVGAYQVAASVSSQQRTLSILMVVLAVVGAAAAGIAGGAGLVLARRAMRPIEEAFSRQQTFIADAAHELRTPVAVVQADADALARVQARLPDEDRALLDDLQRESGFIGEVVGRLLRMARIDAGVEEPTRQDFDLLELANEAAGAMQGLANASGVRLSVDAASTGPVVTADRVQLRLVLMSIIDNGVKYNFDGGTVMIRVSESRGSGVLVTEDSGVGIEPGDVENVFDRFYRVDRARSRADGGVGLGLSIAKATIEANGGTIAMRSAAETGTTVTVELPLAMSRAGS